MSTIGENTKSIDKITDCSPRDHDLIIKKIIESEFRFLDSLEIIITDYIRPLSAFFSNNFDSYCIEANIDNLSDLHKSFLNRLKTQSSGGHGRTERICRVFIEYEPDFIRNYTSYISKISKALDKLRELQDSKKRINC